MTDKRGCALLLVGAIGVFVAVFATGIVRAIGVVILVVAVLALAGNAFSRGWQQSKAGQHDSADADTPPPGYGPPPPERAPSWDTSQYGTPDQLGGQTPPQQDPRYGWADPNAGGQPGSYGPPPDQDA